MTVKTIPMIRTALLALTAVNNGSYNSWNFGSVRLPLLEMEKIGRSTSVGY